MSDSLDISGERLSAPAALPELKWGELIHADEEQAYRLARLPASRPWALVVMLSVTFPNVAFIASDYALYGTRPTFWALAALRSVFLIICAVTAFIARRTEDARTFERVVFIWALALVAVIGAVNLSRPADYVGNLAIDVLIAMSCYAALPLRLRLQVTIGVLISVVALGTMLATRDFPSPMYRNVTLVAFLYTNALGAAVARQFHVTDRGRYVAFEHQRQTLELLDVMNRLVPMCASCKNIRGEDGSWGPIETFVADETGADVSHGICPTCVEELYPGYAERQQPDG